MSAQEIKPTRPSMRPCEACYTPRPDCFVCSGTGWVPTPDRAAILADIIEPTVDGGARLTDSPPDYNHTHYRSFYVWKWARFCARSRSIPNQALEAILGDPYEPELRTFARAIARRYLSNAR